MLEGHARRLGTGGGVLEALKKNVSIGALDETLPLAWAIFGFC